MLAGEKALTSTRHAQGDPGEEETKSGANKK